MSLRFIPRDFEPRIAYGGELEERQPHDWNKCVTLCRRAALRQRNGIISADRKAVRLAAGDDERNLYFQSAAYAFATMRHSCSSASSSANLISRTPAALAVVLGESQLDAEDFARYAASDGPEDLELWAEQVDRDGIFQCQLSSSGRNLFWGTMNRLGSQKTRRDGAAARLRRPRVSIGGRNYSCVQYRSEPKEFTNS